jgi:hypothetical protein
MTGNIDLPAINILAAAITGKAKYMKANKVRTVQSVVMKRVLFI